jgi:O-antigen ligase
MQTRLALAGACLLALLVLWLSVPVYAAIAGISLAVLVISLRFPIAGFALLAISVPWAGSFAVTAAGFPISLTDVIAAGLSGAWLGSAIHQHRPPLAVTVWTGYIAIFLLAIAASATQAADWHASLREIVKWVEMAAVYLAGTYFIRSSRQVAVVVGAVVLAGVGEALLGYIQFFFQLGPEAFAVHRIFLRAYGTFDQPNPYAGYMNLVLPLALSAALLYDDARLRRTYGLATVLVAGAIVASESRGAFLAGTLAGAIVLSVLYRPVYAAAWTGLLGLLGGAWLAVYGLLPIGPFQQLLSVVGLGNVSFGHVTDANFSAVERAAHWLAGVRMFASRPLLGVGIGNYAQAYPAYHPRGWYASLQHAHNYYINIAAEAGIIGLAAYLLLAGSALWYSYAAMRRALDAVERAAVLGVTGALVATDFHNLFDVLYVHGITALLGLLLALVGRTFVAGMSPFDSRSGAQITYR